MSKATVPEIIPITNKQIKDITGQTFGRLTVLGYVGSIVKKRACWLCECECGKKRVVIGKDLRSRNTQSCGCLQTEKVAGTGKANKIHGMEKTPEYQAWRNMLRRCYDPKNISYSNYGGRGITVCERWRNSLESFCADIGQRPGPEYSVDRKEVNGNYEPGNCRWATRKEQANNRRANRH